MRQFEPVKVTMDYGTRAGSPIWQQAGKLWQVNAVIGLVMLLILSDFYVFLVLIAENNSHLYINLPSDAYYVICYIVPVFPVGFCWRKMITKGGVASWLWGFTSVAFVLFALFILISIALSSGSSNVRLISISLSVLFVLLLVSQIFVARRAVKIRRMQRAGEEI